MLFDHHGMARKNNYIVGPLYFIIFAAMVTGHGCGQRKQAASLSEIKMHAGSDIEHKLKSSPTGESVSKWPANATSVIRGEVIYVNQKHQKITIKEIVTGNQITTRVSDPSTLGSFVRGDRVRVTFASPDTATATNVVAEEK